MKNNGNKLASSYASVAEFEKACQERENALPPVHDTRNIATRIRRALFGQEIAYEASIVMTPETRIIVNLNARSAADACARVRRMCSRGIKGEGCTFFPQHSGITIREREK